MRHKTRASALACALLLTCFLPAAASAEASQWLDKLGALYERSPFSFDYTLDMEIEQQGQKMTMSGKGDMLYGSGQKMRMHLEMAMAIPGMGEPIKLAANSVGDGENQWTEIDHPMMGKQVIKVSNADAERATAESSLMGGIGTTNTDPLAQIEKMRAMFDLQETGTEGDSVVLKGQMTDSAREQLGPAAAIFGDQGELVLHLARDTGFPTLVTMGPAGAPVLTMRMQNLEFLDGKDVPEGSFSYTPPAGVNVVEPLAQQSGGSTGEGG